MWKKFVVLGIVVFGFASASSTNAGTEIVRDYGGREVNQYAPPPPAPVYYAPPPVGVVVYPSYPFFGPRFRFVGVHRFDGRRFDGRRFDGRRFDGRRFDGRRGFVRSHHHFR